MYTCSCFFLDVGEGTSQIIYLGKGKAIIIDTGSCKPDSNYSILEKFIEDKAINCIEAVIISHSDEDHFGNAATLIRNHIDKINSIYLSLDKNTDKQVIKQFWQSIKQRFFKDNQEVYNRKKFKPFNAPQNCYSNNIDNTLVKLDLLYPTHSHTIEAGISNNANLASAILLFSIGNKRILFTGDAPYSAFKYIEESYGTQTVDIITVPHHGGNIIANSQQLNYLYSNIIKTNIAIVSVGRNNKYNHPKPEVLETLVRNNIEIFCTQLSKFCCPPGHESEWKNKRGYEGLEFSTSSKNESQSSIPCAGTIEVVINDESITISNIDKLRQYKQDLKDITKVKPLCLKADHIE